ncbi:hypothetical protein TIFTF001_041867 [Ficus carica]|uniref:Cytochrome P450 n=1 Tax=Ficus carica TaxID=3494 RepID=A0AA87ZJN5_FICCA|nr:hypothetical protein TIFTF001_041867 [Ficus carica]
MFLAGTNITAVTLEWAMSNLQNHSDVLNKAKDEVDAQVGQQHLGGRTRPLKASIHKKHNFRHSLRLYPPTPLLIPHYSSDNCTIDGYDVPRGTILLVNAWTIQRDPRLWEDAESFKPERLETGEDDAHKLMTFGLDRRASPGASLAQNVLGLTLGR